MNERPRNEDDVDVDDWLEALSGRAPQEGSNSRDSDGQLLRAAMLRRYKAAAAETNRIDLDHAHKRLLSRLAKEGLIDQPVKRIHWQRPFAMAASVLVVAIAISLLFNTIREPGINGTERVLMSFEEVEVARGPLPIHEIITKTPDTDSRSLALRLTELEVPFELLAVEQGKARLLRIQMEGVPELEALRAELESRGIIIPDTSILLVRFTPAR